MSHIVEVRSQVLERANTCFHRKNSVQGKDERVFLKDNLQPGLPLTLHGEGESAEYMHLTCLFFFSTFFFH